MTDRGIDWEAFKETEFVIKCTENKDMFFSDCSKYGIYNFLGERAKTRKFFICRLCYKDQFSDGRYELMSLDEWQVQAFGLFGKQGLEVVNYD